MTIQRISARYLPNKHLFAAIAIIALLFSLEMKAWRKFDWALFVTNARYINLSHAVIAFAIINATFLLRAVRWSVLVRPLKDVSTTRLIGPTFVGFTGLALLGRAGELVRPCLISRKEGLSISSQLAALTLERIVDTASLGALILATVLFSSKARSLPYAAEVRKGTLLLLVPTVVSVLLISLLSRNCEWPMRAIQRISVRAPIWLAKRAAKFTEAFVADLNTICNTKSLSQIMFWSIAIWFLIALAYFEATHAFDDLSWVSFTDALLLMGFCVLGSFFQLPGGGTPQLIMIAALVHVFGVSGELAVSCAILAWLTIYMAPVPVGMALLHLEHSSLRTLLRYNLSGTERK